MRKESHYFFVKPIENHTTGKPQVVSNSNSIYTMYIKEL